MELTLQEVQVKVESAGDAAEGRLVFLGWQLVAVLVRLSEDYGGQSGHWFLEHGFGRLDGPQHPTFHDLDAAQAWIIRQLGPGG